MFKTIKRTRLSLADEIQIHYWRLVFRLARFLGIWEARLVPYRQYFWLPVLAFPLGVLLGFFSGR